MANERAVPRAKDQTRGIVASRRAAGLGLGLALVATTIGLTASPTVGAAPAHRATAAAIGQTEPADIVGLLPVPDPLPAGEPGTLIASAPFAAGDFEFGVEAHQVLYRSTDVGGHTIAVSGIVLVPTGVPAPATGRAVVAWAHGTTGLADGCAPSLDNQYGGRLNSPHSYDRIDALLAAGHVVVASDYPGLGTPGVHPYLDGDGEGRAVLDSIRLARLFGGTGPAVIQGFSQGSQAALFAGQLWPTYAPEIDLRAVVGIGTPSLYGSAFAAIDLPVVQSYIAKIVAGIVAANPQLPRGQILTPSGEAAYDAFAASADGPDASCADPQFDLPGDLAADPMTIPAWREAIESDYPGRTRIEVPVLMVQSADDEQALAILADGVCRDLQARGTDLRMWRYQGLSHVDTVSTSADDRMRWIDDRLAGRPFTDGTSFTGEQIPAVLTRCPADDSTATTTTSPTTSTVPPTVPSATGARPRAGSPRFTG